MPKKNLNTKKTYLTQNINSLQKTLHSKDNNILYSKFKNSKISNLLNKTDNYTPSLPDKLPGNIDNNLIISTNLESNLDTKESILDSKLPSILDSKIKEYGLDSKLDSKSIKILCSLNKKELINEIQIHNITDLLLLKLLSLISGNLTSRELLSYNTGIKESTIKTALKRLTDKKIFKERWVVKAGCFWRIFIIVNQNLVIQSDKKTEKKCNTILKKINVQNLIFENENTAFESTVTYTVNPIPNRKKEGSFKNPSFCNKNYLSNPELKFWEGEGLTDKQIQKFEKDYNIPRDNLEIYLAWCAFDIEFNKRETGRATPIRYLEAALKKNGSYNKPRGYKSNLEKQKEILQQELEEQERVRKENEALKTKLLKEKALNWFSNLSVEDLSKIFHGDIPKSTNTREYFILKKYKETHNLVTE